MNGDVGKEFGESSPTSNSDGPEMSASAKDVSSAELPVEMTDAGVASSLEMKDNPEVSMASRVEEPINGEAPVKEEEEDKVQMFIPASKDKDKIEADFKTEMTAEGLPLTPTTQSETLVSNEPLTREQIKDLVSQNVEYFFSRENWSSDPYLLSQMDSDQYVPVYILANCSQFKSITKDHSIIMDVLKDSVFVQLDEENNRVRPNYKRCIVILREIPQCTPVKDIEAMFEGEGCPKSLSCEFVHNDSWYVTFESDSDAQKAYRYLRETVKTFKDKPILARIKTKPMSRIGCLSVLPSYGAKSQGDSRESLPSQGSQTNSNSCLPPGAPPGPGMQGIPNPPPPPNAYPPGNPTRMFYPPQNNMNPSYHNYNNFAGSAQIHTPTAYFYPNPMVPWAPNFYDINSFIQYNGLSPRATYKPPTNTRFNNTTSNNNINGNINRRNKSRDNRFEKNDPKYPNNPMNGTSHTHIRSNQVSSRPHSANSPLHSSQSVSQNSSAHHSSGSPVPQLPSSSKGECATSTNSPINMVPSSSHASTTSSTNTTTTTTTLVHNSHNFAQNDLSLASQSNLYTSFCPPVGDCIPKGSATKPDIGTAGYTISPPVSDCNPEENASTMVQPSTSGPCTVQASTTSSPNVVPQVPSSAVQSTSAVIAPLTALATSQSLQVAFQLQPPPPPMAAAPSRSNFVESHPNAQQPPRQMSRGVGRRRLPRREDDVNGYPIPSGRGGGRGGSGAPGPVDGHPKIGTVSEVKKPFELQATSFPPLPSTDEIVASVPEEKVSEAPSQAAWSGEPQKFSDVMKGTAKPKQVPAVPCQDKETPTPEVHTTSLVVCAASTVTTPTPLQSTAVVASGNKLAGEPGPSSSRSQSGTTADTSSANAPAIGSTSKLSSDGLQGSSTTANTSSANTISGPSVSMATHSLGRGGMFREQRLLRDERRGPGPHGGFRRDREFVSGMGRAALRKEKESLGFRLSGNKENRPQGGSSRGWREERPDSEGWITKGARDGRNQREYKFHQTQHNFYDTRNGISKQTMVNGDSSPPPSPAPEVKHIDPSVKATPPRAVAKSDVKTTKSETMSVKDNLNNNEGEHKTSWAKMALASKDHMERLSAELKEKEEQERLRKIRTTKPPSKLAERLPLGREREGKPSFRRENFVPRDRETGDKTRDFRTAERNPPFGLNKPMREMVPRSPK